MKKYILGLVSGVLLTFVAFDVTNVTLDRLEDNFEEKCDIKRTAEEHEKCYNRYKELHPHLKSLTYALISPGIGLTNPLSGRCIKTGSVIRGKEYKGRDYFECNKIQIVISDLLYSEDGHRNL